jgi:cysteinyl-tRNA synthetase
MDDDLNTAGAIGIIFDKVKELNRIMDETGGDPSDFVRSQLKDERNALLKAAAVLGILNSTPSVFFSRMEKPSDIDESEIEDLIKQRNDARVQKDWGKADAIRDKLQKMGIVLEDKASITKWRKEV